MVPDGQLNTTVTLAPRCSHFLFSRATSGGSDVMLLTKQPSSSSSGLSPTTVRPTMMVRHFDPLVLPHLESTESQNAPAGPPTASMASMSYGAPGLGGFDVEVGTSVGAGGGPGDGSPAAGGSTGGGSTGGGPAAGGSAAEGPGGSASGLLVNGGSDVGTIASKGTALVEPGSTGLPQEIANALSSTEQISSARCLCADIPTPKWRVMAPLPQGRRAKTILILG